MYVGSFCHYRLPQCCCGIRIEAGFPLGHHARPYIRHEHHRIKYKKHHTDGLLGYRDDDKNKKKYRKKQDGYLGAEGDDDDDRHKRDRR